MTDLSHMFANSGQREIDVRSVFNRIRNGVSGFGCSAYATIRKDSPSPEWELEMHGPVVSESDEHYIVLDMTANECQKRIDVSNWTNLSPHHGHKYPIYIRKRLDKKSGVYECMNCGRMNVEGLTSVDDLVACLKCGSKFIHEITEAEFVDYVTGDACFLCLDTNLPTYRHHVVYEDCHTYCIHDNTEKSLSVHLCQECHFKIHHEFGFYDYLDPGLGHEACDWEVW